MNAIILMVLLNAIIASHTPIEWNISTTSTSLLSSTYGAFIGHYNSSIFILGGHSTSADVIEYNTNTQSFINHINSFSFGKQSAQSSFQVGNMFYMLPYGSRTFTMMDMETMTASSSSFTSFPGNSNRDRCVSYNEHYLFVVGGYGSGSYFKELYILNVITNTWSTGTSLPQATALHSCNVVDDILYVIGGVCSAGSINVYYDDVFILPLTNGSWNALNDTLSSKKNTHRSVVFDGKEIYVIGGYNGNNILGEVDIINTADGTINPGKNLIYEESEVAAIILDATIYVFGGNPSTNNDRFQYSSRISAAPSNAPTISPSNSPTLPPTNAPTLPPTNTPSNAPTNAPTLFPTSVTEYSQQIGVKYQIYKLSEAVKGEIKIKGDIKTNIIPFIKKSYVDVAAHLEYRQFYIIIADDNIDFKQKGVITLISSVRVKDATIQDLISYTTRLPVFINNTKQYLWQYFNNQ
eukprot:461191_1